MKLKLDENLPDELSPELSSRGHDVHTVPSESLIGHDDPTILRAAAIEGRNLLTRLGLLGRAEVRARHTSRNCIDPTAQSEPSAPY
jgi:hypothetical protein